nr:hypothetical protein Iba_chr04fCG13810 [Ipomoea batatas]
MHCHHRPPHRHHRFRSQVVLGPPRLPSPLQAAASPCCLMTVGEVRDSKAFICFLKESPTTAGAQPPFSPTTSSRNRRHDLYLRCCHCRRSAPPCRHTTSYGLRLQLHLFFSDGHKIA